MHQGCLPAQIGKLCSKRSGRIASGRSRSAETPSSALSHGQDPDLPCCGLTTRVARPITEVESHVLWRAVAICFARVRNSASV